MNEIIICPNCKSILVEIKDGYIDLEGNINPDVGFCEECGYEDFLENFTVKSIKSKKNKNYKIHFKKLKI